MNFGRGGLDLSPEETIALLDTRRQTAIKCRHHDVVIPCLPRIFTTSIQHPFPLGESEAQQQAINRRYIRWKGCFFLT